MKQGLLLTTLVLFGLFVGNLIGGACLETESLVWLGEVHQIGFSTFDLDLHLFVLTIGLQIKFSVAQLVLMLAALLAYPKLSNMIFG